MAAATVSVPPITAQTPTRKPEKLFTRSSLLMTFMGEISGTISPSYYYVTLLKHTVAEEYTWYTTIGVYSLLMSLF